MIDATKVHETLAKYQLVDGFPFVMDLEGSHGAWLRDARDGTEYLDCFTGFASWPLGYNHPRMTAPDFAAEILRASLIKPANSDIYTREMAAFVETFGTQVTPPGFPHHFWVSGGALAVENTLKTAFDWKARKLGRISMEDSGDDLAILHFREAFHGRSGYTMSLTNTDPTKVGLFPKFHWPRVHNPKIEFGFEGEIVNDVEASEDRACREIEAAFADPRWKIAGILIEPMQGEGGDNHFRTEFLRKLRDYADENQALLIYDEVQTGFFGSGKPWLWQHHGVEPDVVAFGKKSQICGIYAAPRIDDVAGNVFKMSSRINSTWGGSLADMVRCRRFIEIIVEDGLAEEVARSGERLIAGLRELGRETGAFSNVRGRGSLVAFTLPSPEERDRMRKATFDQKLLLLPSGERSLRFRLPFVIGEDELTEAIERVAATVPARV